MNHLLFDVETTGKNPEKDLAISLGAILYNDVTEETHEFTVFMNWSLMFPNFNVPDDVIAVHGITLKYLHDNGVHPVEAFNSFYKWICEHLDENEVTCNLAFNIPFDINFIHSNLKMLIAKGETSCEDLLNFLTKDDKNLFIDPLVIDRILHFEVDGIKVKHNLQAVGERYGIPEDVNAHDALADTRRTLLVWKIQMQELKDLGIELNEVFEKRLEKAYLRNEERYKSKETKNYYANGAKATRYA